MLTKAGGHRWKACALEKLLCGLRGPSVWGVGWWVDREFPVHVTPGSVLGRVGATVGTACLCGGALGLPSSVGMAVV